MLDLKGNTAVYLLYAHARIAGIARKVGQVVNGFVSGGNDESLWQQKTKDNSQQALNNFIKRQLTNKGAYASEASRTRKYPLCAFPLEKRHGACPLASNLCE
jgi:arginyl-tRNA synthetase